MHTCTDGRTENICSIFRDKLLLLGENVFKDKLLLLGEHILMIVFSSFNNVDLFHSMFADCCMLKSQEWGPMVAIG
jgi:hypothetical protein